MVIIILHNNREYLESINEFAKKMDIKETTIFEKENIGSRLIGESVSLIFHKGEMLPTYDKAFIAVVKGNERAKYFLDIIENDKDLNVLNAENEGFICTVPFSYIKNLELESSDIKKGGNRITLTDYLKEGRILINLKASNKKEAILELFNLLKDSKEVVNSEDFLRDIMERESLNTTGINNNIAIPHARTEAIRGFIMAFGRSSDGVDFNSLDNKPAKLIFLMGTPKEKGISFYMRILAYLSRLLRNEYFREALLKASSSNEILKEFKKAEQ